VLVLFPGCQFAGPNDADVWREACVEVDR
jgi:hypothetical protein